MLFEKVVYLSVDGSARILAEYDEKCELYEAFTQQLHDLIYELLEVNGLNVVSVTSRPKERDKLEEKIKKNEAKYLCLGDITDISGLRIITYFADDVDCVAEIIESEFEIDRENSVDKRDIMLSDEFGYLSLHYVVSLPERRVALSENQRFRDCKAEIQIRSILQHAWAEIEHDLGYKTELEIPQKIRRRFTRIAGLLEVADSEFDAIRRRLTEYQEEVSQRILEEPTEVLIDKLSLTSFLTENLLVKNICQKVSYQTGLYHYDDDFGFGLSDILKELDFLGIKTISELEALLSENCDLVIKWAVLWLTPEPDEPKDTTQYFGSTIPIFYLNYVLVAKTDSLQKILEFIQSTRKTLPDKEKFVKEIMSTYHSLLDK